MLGGTGEGYEQWLAKAIWNDKVKATYEELGTDKNGNEILGRHVQGAVKEILLDKDLLEGGREGSAKLAAVMAHEGVHLTGNRYEGIAHLQGNSTYNAINEIFGLQGDGEFSENMIGAIMNNKSWVANTGDVDNFINVKGDQKDIDAFKQFIYEKTGHTISVGTKGGVSIEDSDSHIGNQTVADTFLKAVKDDDYTIPYEIVNGRGDVFFDAFWEKGTALFDIGDFLSANKTAEELVTAFLMHSLVEQMYAGNVLPKLYKNKSEIYGISHKMALREENILLFDGKVDAETLYGGGIKRDRPIYVEPDVYKIIYRNGKEQIAEFLLKLNNKANR
jgi:hypothetical protein